MKLLSPLCFFSYALCFLTETFIFLRVISTEEFTLRRNPSTRFQETINDIYYSSDFWQDRYGIRKSTVYHDVST